MQLSLYQMGARESWRLETSAQSYFYVLTGEKVPVEHSEEELERVQDDGGRDRRRDPQAALRADALAGDLPLLRLPDHLPGGGEVEFPPDAPLSGARQGTMTIGTSLFLIAVGAILRYAVDATVAGLDIQTAGLILMIIGVDRPGDRPVHAGQRRGAVPTTGGLRGPARESVATELDG